MRTFWIALCALALGGTLAAGPSPAGVVTSVSGKALLYAAGGDKTAPVTLNKQIFAGDRIKTLANGRVALVLLDGTKLRLNYNSDITLRDKDSKGKSSARGIASIKVALGDLWAKITKKDSTLEFETPAAVAAVKGTEPIFGVTPDGQTCIKLRNGKVLLTNDQPGGGLTLDPNQQICIAPHQAITQALVHPWDGKGGTFESEFKQASHAAVTVNYVDGAGRPKSVTLDYGLDSSTPSQSK